MLPVLKLKIFLTTILFLTFLGNSVAQSYLYQRYYPGRYQMGIKIGGSNYHGDLAKEIVPEETNLMVGVFAKRNFSDRFAMTAEITYGHISGSDKHFDNYHWRNLSFYTDIYEVSWQNEVNFREYGVNVLDNRSTPFLIFGLSAFMFNPKAEYNGEEIKLQKLGTEGQNLDGGPKKYKLIQPALLLGMGYKYNLSYNMEIGFKVGFRKTWTDYLDDVSKEYPNYTAILAENGQASAWLSHRETEMGHAPVREGTMRGDPKLKDWFAFAGITISYRFTPSTKCP